MQLPQASCLCATLLITALGCNSQPAPSPAASASSPAASASSPAASAPSSAAASAQATAPAASGQPAAPTSAAVTDTLETSAGPVSLTPIHHGTMAFTFGGKTIVVDPWSEAPKGWLPKADLVLLTDIHPDHLDLPALELVRQPHTVLVGPQAVADKLPEAEVKVLANGQELTEVGVRIRATPMYNLTRGPQPGQLYHEKGRGNGYLLGFGDKQIYLSGDTACTEEMRALKDIDLALISMNLPYTMPPEEAAECVKAFKPKVVIPFHYRGSDLEISFRKALEGTDGVEVRLRDFYRQP